MKAWNALLSGVQLGGYFMKTAAMATAVGFLRLVGGARAVPVTAGRVQRIRWRV